MVQYNYQNETRTISERKNKKRKVAKAAGR